MDQTKKDKCNGFCGEQECMEYQKEDPNICKRLNHKRVNEIMDQVIRDHGHILKDIKD